MARATHSVGFRHFTFGEWREPGTLVDASTWPNRGVLEENGYLVPLPPEEQVELGEESEAPAEDQVEKAELADQPADRPEPQPESPPTSTAKPSRRKRSTRARTPRTKKTKAT